MTGHTNMLAVMLRSLKKISFPQNKHTFKEQRHNKEKKQRRHIKKDVLTKTIKGTTSKTCAKQTLLQHCHGCAKFFKYHPKAYLKNNTELNYYQSPRKLDFQLILTPY